MKEIACEEVLLANMAEADGETPELSREEIATHLSTCENCAAEVTRMLQMDAMLQRSARADAPVDIWPSVSAHLSQAGYRISWQPFAIAVVLLVAYKLLEMIPEEDPGMIFKIAPLAIFAGLMLFLRENPFKINCELVLEKWIMSDIETKQALILGQKYAFATIALVLGIFSFVNLLGLEKPILAIVFGWLALRATPEPKLNQHRAWAKVGMVLGAVILIAVPTLIIIRFDEVREFIEILSRLNGGR